MTFRLQTVTHQNLFDRKGRLIPTVIASPVSEEVQEEMAAISRSQEDDLLRALAEQPDASLTQLATTLGWKTRDGKPNKSMAQRKVDALVKDKLITKGREGYSLTPKGLKSLEKIT
jgi:hypothetical protein